MNRRYHKTLHIRGRAIRLALWIWLALGLFGQETARAQQDERAVRAAFVFNLTKYVSWPGVQKHLVIGVVDEGSMGPVLKQILEKKVSDGREISIVIHPSDAELRDCNLVYFSESSPAKIRSLLNRIGSESILTVGESDQFARAGGMVSLVRSGDQIEIEVNLKALRERKLDMSSRLLNLAVLVPANGGMR